MTNQFFGKSTTNFLANQRPIFWQINDQFFGKMKATFGK